MAKRLLKCRVCGGRKKRNQFRLLFANAEAKHGGKNGVCQDCQRQRGPGKPMGPYIARDMTLRAMGFASYADYLSSDLWRGIRLRVLKLRGFKCQCCGAPAELVHHNLYRRRELCGQSLRGMKALCHRCHEEVEFCDGRKVGPTEASHRFVALAGR